MFVGKKDYEQALMNKKVTPLLAVHVLLIVALLVGAVALVWRQTPAYQIRQKDNPTGFSWWGDLLNVAVFTRSSNSNYTYSYPTLRADPRFSASPIPTASSGLESVYYFSPALDDGVQLANGAGYTANGDGYVALNDYFTTTGDLSGDGTPETVGLFTADNGGTGIFYEIGLYKGDSSNLTYVDSVSIDDRAQINSIVISGGVIKVDAIIHTDKDPSCCPTEAVILNYHLVNNKLELIDQKPVQGI